MRSAVRAGDKSGTHLPIYCPRGCEGFDFAVRAQIFRASCDKANRV